MFDEKDIIFGKELEKSFLFVEDKDNNDEKLEEVDSKQKFYDNVQEIIGNLTDEKLHSYWKIFKNSTDAVEKAIQYHLDYGDKHNQKTDSATLPSNVSSMNQSQSVHTSLSSLLMSSSVSSQIKKRKTHNYGYRSDKKAKSDNRWQKFIGSIQVNAMTTRPMTKPLTYGSELKIVKSLKMAERYIHTTKGKKKTSMATLVRLYDFQDDRELGKFPEQIAYMLFFLMDSDQVEFEATMVFCGDKRMSIGDIFIVQLDCFLTSSIFFTSLNSNISITFNNHDSDGISVTRDDLQDKNLTDALHILFDQIKIKPIVDESNILSDESLQVFDLEENSTLDQIIVSNPEEIELQNDSLDLKQLKVFYKNAQSSSSIANLPETEPSNCYFKLVLRRYQKQGLTWMLKREHEFNKVTSISNLDDLDNQMINPLWKQFEWPKDRSWASTRNIRAPHEVQGDKFFYANLHTGQFSNIKPVLKSIVKGGILADEMGLGKTISTIAMIATVPYDSEYEATMNNVHNTYNNDIGKPNNRKPYAWKTTLIVVPTSLLSQWQNEFEKATKDLKYDVYYGGNIDNLRSALTKTNSPLNVLITTYGIVQSEWARITCITDLDRENCGTGLFSVEFFRIVIDEGHIIRNRSTRTAKSILNLSSSRKWILTGTPIINKLDDLYSLIQFLNLEPWSQVGYWKQFVTIPFEKKNYREAIDVVSSILEPVLLRRTKSMKDNNGNLLVTLPPKEIFIEKVQFNENENLLYKFFLGKAETSVKESLVRGDLLKKYSTILVHILRLRQICCHIDLLGSNDENDEDLKNKHNVTDDTIKLDSLLTRVQHPNNCFSTQDFDTSVSMIKNKYLPQNSLEKLECSICTNDHIELIEQALFTSCGHIFCKTCLLEYIIFQQKKKLKLLCPNCRNQISQNCLLQIREVGDKRLVVRYEEGSKSSKINALFAHIRRLQDVAPGEQVVIFSQFSSYLDILQNELHQSFSKEIEIYKFDGRLDLKERSKVLNDFSQKHLNRLKILLLSLRAGGVGLNLTCASYAFMMDPWWSPGMEEQAIDRLHRIGQTNSVKVYRFIMENSIEEKMLRIQDKKKSLGDLVEASEDERKKRRIEEIQMLFE